jgi:hypothetical protein
LIKVPSPFLVAPLVLRRRYLIAVLWPLRRCASRVLDRGAQADARGAKQVLDRSSQAVARSLFFKSLKIMIFMENPLIAGFVEKQHEAKTWAWSGKTTEGQASPSDCRKTAKIISD